MCKCVMCYADLQKEKKKDLARFHVAFQYLLIQILNIKSVSIKPTNI